MTGPRPDMAERVAQLLARPPVRALLDVLNGTGAETRIVGGAVRNTVMCLPANDIDLATTLKPDDTMARAKQAGFKVIPTGLAHGTVTVVVDGTPFEVTTLRRDVETDGRHAIVAFSESFEEDALRRDFTINQFSLSADGTVHDYADGLSDLAARKVRFIGEPTRRIMEDYLRIMRFFRFHAEYGEGALDDAGLAACAALKGGMARLSAERIRAELMKLLVAKGAAMVVAAFVANGIWHEVGGDVPAYPEALQAAVAAFPASDGPARLAALAVRTGGDAASLDARLRLHGSERLRLENAARAFASFGGVAPTDRAWQLAGLHHGESAAMDVLGIVASDIGGSRVRELGALPVPVSPFRGADVLALGVAAGPHVGAVIARANRLWADLGFPGDVEAQRHCLRDALA